MVTVKRSVCPHDCPDTCGLLVGVDGDRVVSVKGDPDHPFTRGAVCVKVNHYPERVHSPHRIMHPLRRTGKKGTGSFERISWDQALDAIVGRYQQIIAEFGGEAILPYSYAGTMGVVQFHAGHPFFHKLGASRLLRTICSAAAEAGFSASMGSIPTTDIESTVDSDLIILWGSNTLSTNMHAWPFFLEACRQGAPIVVIDPYENRTAREADIHLKLLPGTDACLALGMMRVLVKEGLLNESFIARETIGFEKLKDRLEAYSLPHVEKITGVPAEQIQDLTVRYGNARAPYIRTGWGPARQIKGGMVMRTIALLPALAGALHTKGGGITRSTAAAFAFNMEAVLQESLRVSPTRTINMVQLGSALTQMDDPPVRALHVYHSNPAVVAPDSSQVIKGLKRDDLFTVVHEIVMSETALYADIVLPATTSMESTDLYRSYGHYYLQMAHPVIPPVGEARSTLAIFQDLATRFGFNDPCFRQSESEIIEALLASGSPYLTGVTLERLRGGAPVRLKVPVDIFSDGFGTPSGKIECYSQTMADQGLDPLPSGEPSVDGPGRGRFGLQLITPPRHQFLNSTFNDIDYLREQAGPPTLMIHPDDARSRGIEENMKVRVFNDRGEVNLYARITGRTQPGVTVAEGLYWSRFMPGNRGINHLTSQNLTDMGQSCAFHCNLVEITPLSIGPESVIKSRRTAGDF
ncbi:MAG: molybdopterin oxidoreductase family protein [Deltaproteobacteria bacterium]|nr:molybdopterin oxidoreductase family protein [Deltaproteobacteria bacterium]